MGICDRTHHPLDGDDRGRSPGADQIPPLWTSLGLARAPLGPVVCSSDRVHAASAAGLGALRAPAVSARLGGEPGPPPAAEIQAFSRPWGSSSVRAGVEASRDKVAASWLSVARYLQDDLQMVLAVREVAPRDRELRELLRPWTPLTSERHYCVFERCRRFLDVGSVCHPGRLSADWDG